MKQQLSKSVAKGYGGEEENDSGRVVNASQHFVSNLSKPVFNAAGLLDELQSFLLGPPDETS